MNFLFSLSVKTWIGIGVAAILIGGGTVLALRGGSEAETLRVERRDVSEAISVTGAVKPSSSIDLEFISSGRVMYRPVAVGDRVARGSVLMSLDARDLDIQIQKAEANFQNAKAKLEQLKAGATIETIRQLENAVDDEYREALSALDAAITKADNVISVLRADVFQSNNAVRTDLYLSNDSFTAEAEADKSRADRDFHALKTLRHNTSLSRQDLDALFSQSTALLDSVRLSGVSATEILRRVVSPAVPQATITTYMSEITTARAGFDTALSALQSAFSAIRGAKDDLLVKREPPRAVDLAVFEAALMAAEADVALLEKQRTDTRLFAPVSGVITKLGFEIGETARAGIVAVSMNAESGLEIEAHVPEIDIAKVAVGNPAAITLDALPDEIFPGKVTHVDPAGTDVGGITNYLVRVAFDTRDSRVRAGVTAEVEIETVRKKDVLAIQAIGLFEKDGTFFVKKRDHEDNIEVPVVVGIRGTDGWVEIREGLSLGEEISIEDGGE